MGNKITDADNFMKDVCAALDDLAASAPAFVELSVEDEVTVECDRCGYSADMALAEAIGGSCPRCGTPYTEEG
nr:MAG TPA: RING finger and CHY zinc-binding protein, Metal-binding, Nucleus, Zinc-finger [Caudoviricetes sp.]